MAAIAMYGIVGFKGVLCKMSEQQVGATTRKIPFSSSELQATSPVMQAIEGIDAMIASGRLIPGQRLLEGDLSEELGVPQGRVREALRILAGSGVVELEPYKSARVRRLSVSEVASLFESITGLFCTGAVLLCLRYARLSATEKQNFLASSDELAQAAKSANLRDLMVKMVNYHGLINRLSGNLHLDTLMSSLHLAHYYKGVEDVIPEAFVRRALGQSARISRAIKAGKPDKTLSILWDAIAPMMPSLQSATPKPKIARKVK